MHGLSGRPSQGATAEQVNVDVINCLAAICSRIDNGAVSLRESLGARDLCGGPLEVAQQLLLFFVCMSDGGDMYSRNYEDVHRSLRLDVRESVAMIILVDGFGRNASIDDLAEDATHDKSLQGARFPSRKRRSSD